MCLIVRRDEDGIRRYVHFGTGNYNPTTARLYTDLSLLTAHPDFGEDATNLFNLLTGISQFKGMRRLVVAPFELHDKILSLIARETENARNGLPARIAAKMNALVDERVIQALYEASRAGVQIDLIVRGICCLRPGLKRLSANIRVRSIVDRFLEHSRIFYFENACQPEVFIGSADWMPRNFFRRVELMVPIVDGVVRERLVSEVLGVSLADNVKARILQTDGSYRGSEPGLHQKSLRSQWKFIAHALKELGSGLGEKNKAPYPEVELAPRPEEKGPAAR
jgi:polyphosphate kinase